MHDPLNAADLLSFELRQRRESGFDVPEGDPDPAELTRLDQHRLEEWYERLIRAPRRVDWSYQEPETWSGIVAATPGFAQPVPRPRAPDPREVSDRILGGWLGRIAGCNLGKPIEDGDVWTPARIRRYLERADAYPLQDYLPPPQTAEDAAMLRACWPETTRGLIDGSARDDDIDYSIIALWLVERHGAELATEHVAEAMLSFLPYLRVFTAERAVMVNLLRGIPVATVADVRNPYREWIGALIRADVYGWVRPGHPEAAVPLVFADAVLTHRANGIYGAQWAAALVSIAVHATTVQEAFDASLDWIPSGSRLAEALRHVRGLRDDGLSWEDAIHDIRRRYGHYAWVHTINNACVIAAGLLWGAGDYSRTVGLTVQGGWDTDSNGATAGSVAGTVLGAKALPAHFVDPLRDRTRSAVFGYDNVRICDLADRTIRLAEAAPVVAETL